MGEEAILINYDIHSLLNFFVLLIGTFFFDISMADIRGKDVEKKGMNDHDP